MLLLFWGVGLAQETPDVGAGRRTRSSARSNRRGSAADILEFDGCAGYERRDVGVFAVDRASEMVIDLIDRSTQLLDRRRHSSPALAPASASVKFTFTFTFTPLLCVMIPNAFVRVESLIERYSYCMKVSSTCRSIFLKMY